MRVAFTVTGTPIPQGSLTGRSRKDPDKGLHYPNAEALMVWRHGITYAAIQESARKSVLPIRLSVQFGMPRPKAHLRLRDGRYVVRMEHYYDRPNTRPDLDKLLRAVCDALTGVAYYDDSQIVEVFASKVYADSTYIEVTDEGLTPQTEAFSTLPIGLGTHKEAHPSKG